LSSTWLWEVKARRKVRLFPSLLAFSKPFLEKGLGKGLGKLRLEVWNKPYSQALVPSLSPSLVPKPFPKPFSQPIFHMGKAFEAGGNMEIWKCLFPNLLPSKLAFPKQAFIWERKAWDNM